MNQKILWVSKVKIKIVIFNLYKYLLFEEIYVNYFLFYLIRFKKCIDLV